MRVVLDTNVVISAFLNPGGIPAQIFKLWRQERFEVVITEAILDEYIKVLQYSRIQTRLKLDISEVADDFREFSTLV
jgi:putative PIN family toxin of toxin-antitoxin system